MSRMTLTATRPSPMRLLVALLATVSLVLAGSAATTQQADASQSNTRLDPFGTLELAGSSWLGGIGANVYSNGSSAGNSSGVTNYVATPSGTSVPSGEKWQCVELINRLYLQNGWITSRWPGNGGEMYDKAPGHLSKQPNGSITNLQSGDVVVFQGGDGGFGHVGIVASISGNSVSTVNQNTQSVFISLTLNGGTLSGGLSGYSIKGVVHRPAGGGGGTPPPAQVTSSTGDAQAAGDFNGDTWGDVAILHERTDGGADVHILYGNIPGYTFGNSSTFIRGLSGADGWDWSKIKVVAGKFNGDNAADLVILHQRPDGGADVHMLQGGTGASMFANSSTWVRSLAGSSGWDWSKMQVVTGDANGDSWDDIVILHQRPDGGADVHILYGNIPGYTFGNSSTWLRSLVGADGWDWSKMKLAFGMFNDDAMADLVVMHQLFDGGIGVHLLQGGSAPFGNSSTWLRNLAASDGWNWGSTKLAAGEFNGDSWDDIVILHQRPDGGADVHILYGNIPGYTFGNSSTWLRSLVGADGWDWSKMKLTAGYLNGDQYADIAILHATSAGGIDVHGLFGSPSAFQNSGTFIRSLPAPPWSWALVKVA